MNQLKNLYDAVDNLYMGKNWRTYLDTFLFGCRVRRLTEATINVYSERLGHLARYLDTKHVDIDNLTKRDLQGYVLSLLGKVSDETVNGRIRAYRRFFSYLEEEGAWEGKPNPTRGLKMVKCERKVKEVVTPTEYELALSCCNRRTFEGYRNFALMLLAWDGMLRRAEIAGLATEHVDLKAGLVRVFGKGRKWREVPVGAKAIKILHYYLTHFRAELGGDKLFCAKDGKSLSYRHIHQIFERTGNRCGIKLAPHLIRHSAATHYLRLGGSPAILSRIMGHSSLAVTSVYVHLMPTDLVNSYEQFSPANSLHV